MAEFEPITSQEALDARIEDALKAYREKNGDPVALAKQLDALFLHVDLLGQHAHLCGQLGLCAVIFVKRRGHGFHFSRQRLRLRYDVFDAAVEFRSAV